MVLTSPKRRGFILLPGRDYELNLPKGHLSPSQILLYLQCAEKYRREYVEGIRGPLTWPLAEGQTMARTMERANKEFLVSERHIAKDRLLDWHRRYAKTECVNATGNDCDLQTVIDRGKEFLTKFDHTQLKPVMVGKTPGVEIAKTIKIAGVPIKLVADLLEAEGVIDFKVASSTRYYDGERDLQMSFYAVAFNRTDVSFCVFCKKKMEIAWVPGTRDLKKTKKWLEIVVSRVAHAISNGVFPPTNPAKDFLCSPKWCPHWETCYGRFV